MLKIKKIVKHFKNLNGNTEILVHFHYKASTTVLEGILVQFKIVTHSTLLLLTDLTRPSCSIYLCNQMNLEHHCHLLYLDRHPVGTICWQNIGPFMVP